ncbi:MAG: hypothetical protein L3J54_00305, partial [Draconibacterium sp.]|nr:hypothetical protein [Draconibacterium sp.]
YFFCQKYYPIPYTLTRIFTYFLIAGILYVISLYTSTLTPFIKYISHTFFIFIFMISIYLLEKRELRGLFKFNKKR